MQRRQFIGLFSAAAAARPLPARAQTSSLPIVGVLDSLGDEGLTPYRQGLRELGYAEGRNLTIDLRTTIRYEELQAHARDLVSRRVQVIAALGGPPAYVAKAATSSIPVVFAVGGDPVELGLVGSLNRPGGNVTGAPFLSAELLGKTVGLLHQLVAHNAPLGVLINPDNPRAAADAASIAIAARKVGRDHLVVHARSGTELDAAFENLMRGKAGLLLIPGDPMMTRARSTLALLALRHRLPACHLRREFAQVGGLMSYGANLSDAYRLAGQYTARILKGEAPADLPVQQPTRFALVLNLKTAKALGIEVPPMLLAIADEVIE